MQKTILCVDDELFMRETLGLWLEDRDYKVLKAHNGRSGYEMFCSEKPDLMLLDLSMPEISGLELIRQVRQDHPNFPIIVISGTGLVQEVIQAQSLGAWAIISKPIEDFKILEHAIKNCFEKLSLIEENLKYKQALEAEVEQRTSQLRHEIMVSDYLVALLREILVQFDPDLISERILNVLREWIQTKGGVIYFFDLRGVMHCSGLKPTDSAFVENQELVKLGLAQATISKTIQNSQHILVIPIEVESLRSGGMVLSRERPFAEEDVRLARKICSLLSLAIQRMALEERLGQEQRNASTALKVKSSFLSQISHELRTPLTATMGMLDLVARSSGLPEAKGYADRGLRSAADLMALINRILQVCNLSQYEFQPDFASVNPAEILVNVCLSQYQKAEDKGLNLSWDLPEGLPTNITSDAMALYQILEALVDNAIKFSSSGSIRVALSLSEDGARLVYSVTDQGPGIAKESQNMIFDYFTQLEDVYTRIHGGAGLGLSIVKRLAEHIGATVSLDSTPGVGSCFCVNMDLRE